MSQKPSGWVFGSLGKSGFTVSRTTYTPRQHNSGTGGNSYPSLQRAVHVPTGSREPGAGLQDVAQTVVLQFVGKELDKTAFQLRELRCGYGYLSSGANIVPVRLYIRARLAIGKRVYADPAYASNCRIKPFFAIIEKEMKHHREGACHLR